MGQYYSSYNLVYRGKYYSSNILVHSGQYYISYNVVLGAVL